MATVAANAGASPSSHFPAVMIRPSPDGLGWSGAAGEPAFNRGSGLGQRTGQAGGRNSAALGAAGERVGINAAEQRIHAAVPAVEASFLAGFLGDRRSVAGPHR